METLNIKPTYWSGSL